MDSAQPSPGAELGLPVIAHSPGHKQQAVACVIQPGEGPACLGMVAGGRERAQRAEASLPARPEVLLSTSSSSEGHQPGKPRPVSLVTTGWHLQGLTVDGYCVIWGTG